MDTFLRNRTAAFLGDSINNLVSVAYECEAAKAVTSAAADWEHESAAARARWEAGGGGFALAPRLAALADYNELIGRREGSWWDAPLVSPGRGTILVHKGYARYNATQLGELLDVVDVVVLNYGHHYAGASADDYHTDMSLLFDQLDAWMRAGSAQAPRAAFFRETGAQHFQGTGAFSSWDQAHPKLGDRCQCAPLAPNAENQITAWNGAVRALAGQHAGRVGVVPFYALTAPRHDLHEGPFCGFGNKNGPQPCCDCTHYCYTPQLWKAWFDSLFTAFEAQAGGVPPAGDAGLGRLLEETAGLSKVAAVRGRALERKHKERLERLHARIDAAREARGAGGGEAGEAVAGGGGGGGDGGDVSSATSNVIDPEESVGGATEALEAATRLSNEALDLDADAAVEDEAQDAPPGPEPPAKKFGRAGAVAEADELKAIEALLASMDEEGGEGGGVAAGVKKPPRADGKGSGDAPLEPPETEKEADATAWYNIDARYGRAESNSAPPGVHSGNAALQAMRLETAAALVAALEPEVAAPLLLNGSAEFAAAVLGALGRAQAEKVLEAAPEGVLGEAAAQLRAGLGAGAEEALPESDTGILHSRDGGGAAAPEAAVGADALEPEVAAGLLRTLSPELGAGLVANMSVWRAAGVLALLGKEEAEGLLAGAGAERRAEVLGARGALVETKNKKWE